LAVSAAIILLALVVLVGWHAHIRAAVRIFGGPNAMHYNSALAFVALGAAGIGLSTGRRLLLLCGGGFALLMGAAAIVEYATGASLGIDTLFLYPWESPVSVNPGRMPLTTYLMQSLICTSLFYGWGLGWDTPPPAITVGLGLAIFALQIAIAHLWLRWFRFGPAEWLWRSIVYWRLQPMR